jgi:hypothetical protein
MTVLGLTSTTRWAGAPLLAWGRPPSAVLRSEAPLARNLSSRPEQLLREAKQLRSGGTCCCFWVAQRFSAAIKLASDFGASAPAEAPQ